MATQQQAPSPALWRLPTVLASVGLSRSALYERISRKEFPEPLSLGGGRAVAWERAAVERWISEQIARGPRSGAERAVYRPKAAV